MRLKIVLLVGGVSLLLAACGIPPPFSAALAPNSSGSQGQLSSDLPKISDDGGKVLKSVKVQTIFWGSAWENGSGPTPAEINDSVSKLMAGPYMSSLDQYRNIGTGSLLGSVVVTKYGPPNLFRTSDVAQFLQILIRTKTIPSPDKDPNLLYVVMMPFPDKSSNPGDGEHSSFLYNVFTPPFGISSNSVHFAWVANNGDLGTVTQRFSHELVEAATNPEGDAFQVNSSSLYLVCGGFTQCEIGDVCVIADMFQGGPADQVGGVMVQSYWSQKDGSCVIPIGGGQILKFRPGTEPAPNESIPHPCPHCTSTIAPGAKPIANQARP